MKLRFSDAAREDISEILAYSLHEFGVDAEARYAELLFTTFDDLLENPHQVGVINRDDMQPGLRTWHLKNSRDNVNAAIGRVNQPRHVVLFRVTAEAVEIGRVLHEVADPNLHLNNRTWQF